MGKYEEIEKALQVSLVAEPSAAYGYMKSVGKGMDPQLIMNFKEHFSLKMEEVATFLDINDITLYRWMKSNKSLDRNTTIKIFEMTELFIYGKEVFASASKFHDWLYREHRGMGGVRPMELLSMPEGINKVRRLLGRIEHGIIS